MNITRRQFIQAGALSLGALSLAPRMTRAAAAKPTTFLTRPPKMHLGLVTYNLAQDWDIPTIIKNCEAAQFEGVELRTTGPAFESDRHQRVPSHNGANPESSYVQIPAVAPFGVFARWNRLTSETVSGSVVETVATEESVIADGEERADDQRIADRLGHDHDFGFDLLVLDSLDVLEMAAQMNTDRRNDLFYLFMWLRGMGITSFLIAETPVDNQNGGRFEEGYLADGVISLKLQNIGETDVQRRIRAVKLRSTNHKTGYFSLMFSDGMFRATQVINE